MAKRFVSTLKLRINIAVHIALLLITSYFVHTYFNSAIDFAQSENRAKSTSISLSAREFLFRHQSLVDKAIRNQHITHLPEDIGYSQMAVKELQSLVAQSHLKYTLVINSDGSVNEAFPVEAFHLEEHAIISRALAILNQAQTNELPRLVLTNANESNPMYIWFVSPLVTSSNSITQPYQKTGVLLAALPVNDLIQFSLAKTNVHANSRIDLLFRQQIIESVYNTNQSSVEYLNNVTSVSDLEKLGDGVGTLSIQLNEPKHYYLNRVFKSIVIMIIISLGGLLLVYWVINNLIKRLSTPLQQVIETADHLAQGNYSPQQKKYSFSEFQQINNALNSMRDTIETQINTLMVAKEKAEQSEKTKSQFLANMSHEIRTPMNGIIGLIQSLEQSNLDETQKDYIKHIKQSSLSLLSILNDILDLSKIDANKIVLEHTPSNVKALVQEVINIFQSNFDRKGIVLNFQYSNNAPEVFELDSFRLKQIITNLIGNALKFTESGSVSINIRATPIEDDYYKLVLIVSDSGIGISSDNIEKLFQPFVQADGNVTRRFGGSGLGLSIVSNLVRLFKGTISVKSELGHGSTFTIELPVKVAKGNVKTELPMAESTPELHHFNILIAEDNLTNQLVMKALMKPTGANLVFANNGKEALELLQQSTFDLIFMDIQMPVLDGLSATRQARHELGIKSPIIGLSANAMPNDVRLADEAGMNHYIAKPIIREKLYQLLSDLITVNQSS